MSEILNLASRADPEVGKYMEVQCGDLKNSTNFILKKRERFFTVANTAV